MRVLLVVDSLAYGGAEHSLVSMLPAYQDVGVQAELVTLADGGTDLLARARETGTRVHVAPSQRVGAQLAWLRSVASDYRPDIVHTTLYRADQLGRFVTVGSPARHVSSLVSAKPAVRERARATRVAPWKLTAAANFDAFTGRRLTDHFHAVSEAVRTDALQRLHLDVRRVTVVPRGRDGRRFSDESQRAPTRAALGVGDHEPLVLHVGRQEPAKGLPVLIRAWREVARSEPHARLILAGAAGSSTPEVVELIDRSGLGRSVELLGRRSDVPALMSASDLVVLPSLWEGLPNVVIEAMASGRAVVASDIPAVRETVQPGDSARLAPPGDADALAQVLLPLLRSPEDRAALGRQGRAHFQRRFELANVAQQMADMYRRVF